MTEHKESVVNSQTKRIQALMPIREKVVAALPRYEIGSIVCWPDYHDDGRDEHFVVLGVEWRRDKWLYTLGDEPSMWQWGKPIYALCSSVDESDLSPAKFSTAEIAGAISEMNNLRVKGRTVIGDNENGSQWSSTFYGPAVDMSDGEKKAFALALMRCLRHHKSVKQSSESKEIIMRAKMRIETVTRMQNCEQLQMAPVCKSGAYPEDGLDEDNTYARFTPSGSLTLTVTNPALLGQFNPGDKYYLDFTKVE